MTRTAKVEGVTLLALGIYLLHADTTITCIWRRLRSHPAGLLFLGAATGAALTHLWLEED